MRVPLSWLKDFVDLPVGAAELARDLAAIGLAVEGMETVGEGLEDVRVARIEAVEPHPAVERLRVCTVRAGGPPVAVVTGAPNARPGLLVPYVPPGGRLPGGRAIEVARLGGVESAGMLCSEVELGIGDDGSGLLELPPATPVGVSLADALGLPDQVIEFEVYPNRPDLLGVLGIAREVAACYDLPLRPPAAGVEETGPPIESLTRVDLLAPDLALRYSARLIRGVRVGPSPPWLARRLRLAGLRPINNVVDVTNYVMWELGQPLHAFDHGKLVEGRLVVRRAHPGERLVTLDGVERVLGGDTLVIADACRACCVAGVMGGQNSEVDAATRDVLLESATFHPVAVRRAARALGLSSEAARRFERGLDPGGTLVALDRAARLIRELAGGEVARGRIDLNPRPVAERRLRLRLGEVERLLGLAIPGGECARLLRRLGLRVDEEPGAASLQVTVPTFRADLEREADLVEEVARLHGYHRIPETIPGGLVTAAADSEGGRRAERVRDTLAAAGLQEALTYSFANPRHFDLWGLPPDHPWRRAAALRNPLSEESSLLRTSLLPGLLEAVARNVHRGIRDLALFEVGAVFLPHALPLERPPREVQRVAVALAGRWGVPGWAGVARESDFFLLKGILEHLAGAFGCTLQVRPATLPGFHPGRAAVVEVEAGDGPPQEAGIAGELHPDLLAVFELPDRVYMAEVDLDRIAPAVPPEPLFQPLPRFPAVLRDMALVVPAEVPHALVARTIRATAGPVLERLTLFDVYEGPPVPQGARSLAFELVYRSPDRTLTDGEVDTIQEQVLRALAPLGVTLRA